MLSRKQFTVFIERSWDKEPTRSSSIKLQLTHCLELILNVFWTKDLLFISPYMTFLFTQNKGTTSDTMIRDQEAHEYDL